MEDINLEMIQMMKTQSGEYAPILEDIFSGIVDAIHDANELEIYTRGVKGLKRAVTSYRRNDKQGGRYRYSGVYWRGGSGSGYEGLLNCDGNLQNAGRSRGNHWYIGTKENGL